MPLRGAVLRARSRARSALPLRGAHLACSGLTGAAQDRRSRRTAGLLALDERGLHDPKDAPHFYLTFRRIASLDVRVYKVKRSVRVLRRPARSAPAGHADEAVRAAGAHRRSSGSPTGSAASARRCATSSRRRSAANTAPRGRAAARPGRDRAARPAERQHLRAGAAAQPDQLVTSWRELLPNRRDTEIRRVPLEVHEPGVYVVEAVNDLLRAYTIVIVSDVGLVTKTSPGQMLMFAANRFTGEPTAGCDVRVLAGAAADRATARRRPTALFDGDAAGSRSDDRSWAWRAAAIRSPPPTRASWALHQPARELVGYIYTDKPIYRPGQTVHAKAVLRWRERGRAAAVRSPGGRAGRQRRQRQGDLPPHAEGGQLRRRVRPRCRCRRPPRSAPTPSTSTSGDRQATGALRGAGVPQAGVRGDRHAGVALRRAGPARRSSPCRRATTSASRWPTASCAGS